jgi:hypothetical protein
MIKVGDKLMLQPTYEGSEHTGPIPCRVIWVHPERRHYVVRFSYGPVGFCESFPCPRSRSSAPTVRQHPPVFRHF